MTPPVDVLEIAKDRSNQAQKRLKAKYSTERWREDFESWHDLQAAYELAAELLAATEPHTEARRTDLRRMRADSMVERLPDPHTEESFW